MNNFRPSAPVAMGPRYTAVQANDQMKEIANERIRLTRALCDAAFEYLSFSDQLALNTSTPEFEPPPYYTVEMLMKVQGEREQVQAQVDQLETAIGSADAHDAMASMMRAGVLLPLKMQLQHCDEYITEIQTALERTTIKVGDDKEE